MQQLNGQKTKQENKEKSMTEQTNSKDNNNQPHAIFSKVNGPAIMHERNLIMLVAS